jgi:hypothetical protein
MFISVGARRLPAPGRHDGVIELQQNFNVV